MATTISGDTGIVAPVGAIYNGLQSATAQATTSGTSITFSSIPSWVKRITVIFAGVSTSGTSAAQVQIGSGSVTTTGYVSTAGVTNAATLATTSYTSGFGLEDGGGAAFIRSGLFTLANLSGNTWSASFTFCGQQSTARTHFGGGYITLSGTLDRIVLTTVNGTDTFDAGSVNIIYE